VPVTAICAAVIEPLKLTEIVGCVGVGMGIGVGVGRLSSLVMCIS
jgi:hypothetical protein